MAFARRSAGAGPSIPAGYVPLDDVDARELSVGDTLYTPHTSGGQTPFGWGLVPVRVEGTRESACGEGSRIECAVVDASLETRAGRVTLAFAPGDLRRPTARRGVVGS